MRARIPLGPNYKLDATSARLMPAERSIAVVAMSPAQAAQLVIDKLGARGFTLVETRNVGTALRLKLAGNRDYSALGSTIGSVYYAWLEPVQVGTQVKIRGRSAATRRRA
jgi:hypothetical protein